MRSVFSWLISALAVMFWVFRIVVAIMATFEIDFIVTPIDLNTEIVLLFVTLPCLVIIIKRNLVGGIVGAIIYFGIYGWYFGMELARIIESLITNGTAILPMNVVVQALVCIVAILISLSNLLDIIFSRFRKSENPSKKVDWFYKKEEYDRKLDERRDKNNYRIY